MKNILLEILKFIKNNKIKIAAVLIALSALSAAFFLSGTSVSKPESHLVLSQITPTKAPNPSDSPAPSPAASPIASASFTPCPSLPPSDSISQQTPANKTNNYSNQISENTNSEYTTAEYDEYITEPIPEGMPAPVEPQDTQITSTELTCTISVSCSSIFDNLKDFDKEKIELLPDDGWIIYPETVVFYEGESVFNVLQRTLKQKKIHMEFSDTPMYNSSYLEGINNIYEFDCGPLSGWMYRVNGWFPNYGCSRYSLNNNDIVEIIYTCDLGADIGGEYAFH